MIARAGSGWQMVLADLSLILFIVAAAVLIQSARNETALAATGRHDLSEQAAPLALYEAGTGSPPLAEWLAEQRTDPRQQLTVIATYSGGNAIDALQRVRALLIEAGPAGKAARIVVEPGPSGLTASLAWDTPPSELAQELQ